MQARQSHSSLHAYVLDGLTKEQYQAIKAKEQNTFKGKDLPDLGRLGPRGFTSRSMPAWQVCCVRKKALLIMHAFAPFHSDIARS